MNDESECGRTLVRAFRALDRFDYDAVLACFAEDGRWARRGVECVGRAAIRENLELRAPDVRVCHLLTNMDVEVDDSRSARITGYNTAFRGRAEPGQPAPHPGKPLGLWEFEARLSRASGDWLIEDLRQVQVFDLGG